MVVLGKHAIINVRDIWNFNVSIRSKEMLDHASKIAHALNLNVLSSKTHNFAPYGCTVILLLSESHLSIHTYPERKYCAIDLYCCNPLINMGDILEVIYNYFDGNCVIMKKIIER